MSEPHSAMTTRPRRCENCPFGGRTANNRGDPSSPVCVVGESPGLNELKEGVPFVGPSGEVLWKTLPTQIKVEGRTLNIPNDIFVTNALCCHPRRKDPAKMTTAMFACRERLLQDINAHPRKLVIALGNSALHALTGDTSYKITQVRGELIPPEKMDRVDSALGALPLVHPAALLRGTGSYRQFKADIEYAVEMLEMGSTTKAVEPHYTVLHGGDRNCQTKPAGPIEPNADEKPTDARTLAWSKKLTALRRRLLKRYHSNKGLRIAADIETSGLDPRRDRILSLGLCYDPRHVYIIEAEALLTPEGRNLFVGLEGPWGWHGGKFDVSFLRNAGVKGMQVNQDSMLLNYTFDERGGVHDLETVARDLLRAPNYKDMLAPYLPNKQTSYEVIPRAVLYEYQAKDVSLTWQITRLLNKRFLDDPKSETLYYDILLPAAEVLIQAESVGLTIDLEALHRNGEEMQQQMIDLQAQFEEICGESVNMNSPMQLVPLLYDKMKIKTRARNTREETLRMLSHPAVDVLRKYRRVAKGRGTYVTGLQKHIVNDKIHTTFNLHGTVTGRLSSSKPNLQNVPRDPLLRNQFIAPDGRIFIEVDLSQAELRSLAALSGDETLCAIYNDSSRSLHTELALELFGPKYTHDQYVRAKAVNFGIVYGRGAKSLSDEFNIPVSEGQRMIDGWFEAFPQAAEFIERCRRTPITGEMMVTVFGRRKRHNVVTTDHLNALQNEAANFPHQSIASDITLYSACRLCLDRFADRMPTLLRDLDSHVANLVHDSILIIAPDNQERVDEVGELVVTCMETTPEIWGITRVPFKADVKTGYKWGSLKEKTT